MDAEEAPLSNFEVLQFLKEMEQQQRLRDKVAKKNKTQAIKPSENQATIMFEVPSLSCLQQWSGGMAACVRVCVRGTGQTERMANR